MSCSIGAEEAEEIGVEHLLRDIRDRHSFSASSSSYESSTSGTSDGTLDGTISETTNPSHPPDQSTFLFKSMEKDLVPLSRKVNACVKSIKALIESLDGIKKYLEKVYQGRLPLNQAILALLQDISHLLPFSSYGSDEWSRSFTEKSNDHLALIYAATLNKAILSLHSLIDNKISNRETDVVLAAEPK